MISKKLLLLFIFSCLNSLTYAQDPFFLNYPQNYIWYNSAYAGADSMHEFSLSGLKRWDNTYSTYMLSYGQPLDKIHSGIGGLALFDQSGNVPLDKYYATANYNYNIRLMKEMSLRIGLQVALNYNYINIQNLTFESQYNGMGGFTTVNPITTDKWAYIDFGAAFWYSYQKFYAGFAIYHIGGIPVENSQLGNGNPDKNYIATAGYNWKINNYLSTIPSALLMVQEPSTYWQLSNDFWLYDTYSLGAGYTPGPSREFSIRGGVKILKKLQVILTYAFISNEEIPALNSFFTTYEANIKYMFK